MHLQFKEDEERTKSVVSWLEYRILKETTGSSMSLEREIPEEVRRAASEFTAEQEKPFEVRTLEREDIEPVLDIHEQGWLATYPSEEFGITREDIHEHFREKREGLAQRMVLELENPSSTAITLVARKEGKTVGFARLVAKENSTLLSLLYVDENSWGKGAAQELMEQGAAWAPSEKPLTLWVVANNERAKNFYRKSGFVETGSTTQMEVVAGKYLPKLQMKRNPEIRK